MKIVSLSVVRNEADIIEAFVRYHCAVLDRMVIIDHSSTDGTLEILQKLQQEGLPVTLETHDGFSHAQEAVILQALRRFLREDSADWFALLDADEFLTATNNTQSIRDAAAHLATDTVWRIMQRTYVPRSNDDWYEYNPFKRMRHRRVRESSGSAKALIPISIAADPRLQITPGNHHALFMQGEQPLQRICSVLEIAHFPYRSIAQATRKVLSGWPRNVARHTQDTQFGYHWKHAYDALAAQKGMLTVDDMERLGWHYPADDSDAAIQSLEEHPFLWPEHLMPGYVWPEPLAVDPFRILAEEHVQAVQAMAVRSHEYVIPIHKETLHTMKSVSTKTTHRRILDRIGRRGIAICNALWNVLGNPFPRQIRYVRHRLLGNLWPAYPPLSSFSRLRPSAKEDCQPKVAVIIPCHNYGRYLGKAIESVLRQTVPAKRIIVVDDASSDDTAITAHRYKDQGVEYIVGAWRNVGKARNAGLRATTEPFLIFLDADDLLAPAYIEEGLKAFQAHPEAGIVSSDYAFFGKSRSLHRVPSVARQMDFNVTNPIHAGSMVRRTALLQAGGWSEVPSQHADWMTWRAITALGWKAVRGGGFYHYRMHGKSMTDAMRGSTTYAQGAGLFTSPVTFCLSLSGRTWMWPLTQRFLEEQTHPHHLIRLIILDTSQDPAFGREVRQWLAACDYRDIAYRAIHVGEKGIADRPRREVEADIGIACSTIYNTFARMIRTPLTFILEDDVIPPPDVFMRLVQSFDRDTISVSGLYWHRTAKKPVCWEWDERGRPVFPEPARGVQQVGGTGFGCLLIRSPFLRRHVFDSGAPHGNYDENFFAALAETSGRKILVDWDCVCRHYQSPEVWY